MEDLAKLFYTCNNLKYINVGKGVDYKFVTEKNHLYIYFQCSFEGIDWFRNFFFLAKKKQLYKNMDIGFKVHGGFYTAWKEVEYIILDKITEKTKEKKEFKWKEITIVGYSHGAALAGICHEFVWFHRYDLVKNNKLWGFGFECPRFYAGTHLNKYLKERWENFIIIRTNNDLVTHLPPKIFGFSHVSKPLTLKGDCSLIDNILPKSIKSHYPQVVMDAIISEKSKKKNR